MDIDAAAEAPSRSRKIAAPRVMFIDARAVKHRALTRTTLRDRVLRGKSTARKQVLALMRACVPVIIRF